MQVKLEQQSDRVWHTLYTTAVKLHHWRDVGDIYRRVWTHNNRTFEIQLRIMYLKKWIGYLSVQLRHLTLQIWKTQIEGASLALRVNRRVSFRPKLTAGRPLWRIGAEELIACNEFHANQGNLEVLHTTLINREKRDGEQRRGAVHLNYVCCLLDVPVFFL